ncbi:MAG: oxidoreductase [Ruminiclostridium sp.]
MSEMIMNQKMKIGNVEIKNRLVMAAMGCFLAEEDGSAGDKMIAFYESRAKGGAGLIITEITRVNDETGVGEGRQLSVTKDSTIPSIQRLADAVHKHGSKIFIQLHHPGREIFSSLIGGKPVVAPSAIPCGFCQQETRALEFEEVKSLIQDFINGAVRAKKGGVDGVELHGAHGYIFTQFLSPRTNKRNDEYGGSFENRCRFLVEIITGIKKACGKDFPISVRLDVTECYDLIGIDDGIKLEEGIAAAKVAEAAGADAINVSVGNYETINTFIEPVSYEQGWRNGYIKAVKKEISVPVIAVSLIRDPIFAEQMLKDRILDFIAMARPWLADPEWGVKALSDHPEDVRKCICCLYCFETGYLSEPECSINPELFHELNLTPSKNNGAGRRVAVVGSGPAGLEASRILSKRGFAVTLFEANDQPGGQVYLSSLPPHKQKMYWFVEYEMEQLKKQGADVRLNTPGTAEAIKALNPYAVILATGSLPVMPASIEGIKGGNVYQPFEILSGEKEIAGEKVVIVGSGLTGLETAEYLAAKGKKVSVFEMQDKIGSGAYHQVLKDMNAALKKYDVDMHPSHRLVSIQSDAAVFETGDGKTVSTPCDAVVMSLGVRSNNPLEKEVSAFCDKVFVIGDANKTARIAHAVKAGYGIGCSLE